MIMRTVNRRVFPIVLLVALTVASVAPSVAQDTVSDSPSAIDGGMNAQAQASGKNSRVKAKLVVDCKNKKSKRSKNKKVKKFCQQERRDGKGRRDAVSAQGRAQQTFNCGTVEFSVDDIGGGRAEFSLWGQSTLGNVLGGGWEIAWTNHNTGASRAPNGTIGPAPGNPTVFFDTRPQDTGRGRVVASLTGFVTTDSAWCFILPPLRAEETVLR
jgi:hypothetical protein